jgi:non-specific serine/threonine protein kinase/serine/threonine-protein kinase
MTAARWGEVKAVLAGVLEADSGERPALLRRLCADDEDLRSTVECLLAFEGQANALLNTAVAPGAPLPEETDAPRTIGPYRVLREIGRGGMGVVYLGERDDGHFRQQAAIKLITGGRCGAGLERRFRRERQILAQLEHPGIARLLDGGATGEGQPYFIMEYIEGCSLLEYCDRNRLDVAGRLSLFLNVCDAVEYAHQRLIVHRDLKPGNILVTTGGTAKLLDFGLARVLDSGEAGDEITLAGLPLMTPAYASPEQIRGEPYTMASDVYSLGVILYELLAARRPYEAASGSLLDLARLVCEQEPVPLSAAAGNAAEEAARNRAATPERLRKRLAGDLDRIAAKALAKDPGLRYARVAELAADVRRHMEGRPVTARPATWRYRAGKLLGRHRVAAPACAAAVALIVGFAGTTWWEARRAERRFQEVRRLAHSVLFELHDAIAKLPGSTSARELLVRRALEYLEGLQREAGGNADVAREVALGYEKVGSVQGDLADSNLGHLGAAIGSFEKSQQILEKLAARAPGDHSLRRDYMRVSKELAAGYASAGDFAKALLLARKNEGIAREALRAQPSAVPALEDAMLAGSTLADIVADEHRYSEAIPIREHVLDLAREVSALQPGNHEAERSVAVAEKRLGALYGVAGRYEECRRQYEEARAIDEQRAARNPSDMRAKLDLSYDYSDLGWVASQTGGDAGALAAYRRALALRQEAASADPNDYRAATSVASSTLRIGRTLRKMGDVPAALDELRSAVALYGGLAKRTQADWAAAQNLADAHEELGNAWMDVAGQRAARAAQRREASRRAADEYRESRELFQGLSAKGVLAEAERKHIAELAAREARVRRVAQ